MTDSVSPTNDTVATETPQDDQSVEETQTPRIDKAANALDAAYAQTCQNAVGSCILSWGIL